MTTIDTQAVTPDLVRQIAQDLLRAAAAFGGDPIDGYVLDTTITQIACQAPVWQQTAVAASLVRKVAGRTSIEDSTDDDVQAAAWLREARSSVNYGLFQRTISFWDARIMSALVAMAESVDMGQPDGLRYQHTIGLAEQWASRWHQLDNWRITSVAVQLIRLVADYSGDPLRMLDTIAQELRGKGQQS
ncbi:MULTISPECIES: hypothetical protein [Mycobacterium]|uniref:Uncharacterized protein n=1 Tax=Mycobacterium intracellulare 1956 TaxID=1299331 RepID=X8CG87_MYCIT|nr:MULTISPECIES: hypothetical protein [Mycobacterium]EUA31996.1 hypothetical protein I548_0765 [Mycobacterium intracellulare]EUA55387.1 hypothetical protein I550_3542 [Mycobacterium intracellulare 1956]UQB90883.1 hypothetical protein KN252_16615 [Mycobacterium intracellulare]WSE48426.1 hypothetical protein QGN30_11320 [Mycobacterium sp. 3-98]